MRRLSVFAVLAAVAAALIALAGPAAAGGGGCHSPSTEAEATTVVLAANCFGPNVAHVPRGATVTFVNDDTWAHTVSGSQPPFTSQGQLDPGQSLAKRFNEPGTYPYVCLLHPMMVGAVVVGDGPLAVGSAPETAAASPVDGAPLAASAEPPLTGGSPTAGWVIAAAIAGLVVGWTVSSVARGDNEATAEATG